MKTVKNHYLTLLKVAYLFCTPVLLFIGSVTLYALMSGRSEANIDGLPLFAFMVWAAIIVPAVWFVIGVLNSRRLLKRVVAAIRDPEVFDPDPSFEMFHEGDCKYLGIDVERGTILYVHKVRKDEVGIVPLTMNDWTTREVAGRTFRLFTKLPWIPRIEMQTPLADRWFDTLGAMEHVGSAARLPFAQHVSRKIAALELNHQVHVTRAA
ncbi:plasmid IncI1-type surface exclusion protein ExcA [Pseudomonas fulva]|uniref:plasmid IncI1-type surface exclusion protein ExcA n=1 Tax=Pseudomonas fulva TaxID=47880 RepID=UPI002DBB179F|nr:plasmid IncI1-type surface exclusion protein ExcA [Pseudomonas fulva]MEB8059264.1 plasmid IncI1-type surface exclusion protein ExcA [Pseudomonas fulva]